HNDLNPGNILFDGQRLWFIDWETAYRNDPLVDVATLTIFIAASPELEAVLLRSWLGREPDRLARARLALMRLQVRLFFGWAPSLHAAHGLDKGMPATDLGAPTRAEFAEAVEQGRLSIGSPEAQRLIGKMALASFLSGVTSPEFDDGLAVVRHG